MGHHHEQSGACGGAAGVQAYAAAVITVSDRCSAGRRDDATGPAVAELLAREGFEVCSTAIVADDVDAIGAAIQDAAAADVAMCVTAGGTGLSPRDVTPEATEAVCERMVPGLGELMRASSAAITSHAWVSRATAGTLGRTLVVNVPGSPKGATENLEAILGPVRHGLKMLRADAPQDCAAERRGCELSQAAASLSRKPCVLFDFDGTLADTKPHIVATATEVLRGFGLTDDEIGDAGRLVGPPFPAAFSLVYGLSEEDAAEVTRRYRAIYGNLGPEAFPLFDGIRELLCDLHEAGRRLAITSSKNERLVRKALAETGIDALFDAVVAAHDPKHVGKEHLVASSLEALGCQAADAVMVGDRFYDIEGARANGVASLGVYLGNTAKPGELEHAGATACVSSVADMRRALLG